MAKIKTTSGTPANTTTGALQVSTQPTGITSVQLHPNNLRSTSPAFVPMNNTIISLDNRYDSFPPATKTTWETAAIPFAAAVAVCGCQNSKFNGKKLHRVTNYLLTVLGSPLVSLPPAYPGPDIGIVVACQIQTSPPYATPGIQVQYNMPSQDCWLIMQQGLGLQNLLIFVPALSGFVDYPLSTPFGAAITSLGVGAIVTFCTWQGGWCPTGTTAVTVT